ncbi:MAG: ribosome biogenesis GTPase YlqF [Mycoplasma sp.]|nr:ribosome biogenesis GTPase YlqF [Mycoplasma sp.]
MINWYPGHMAKTMRELKEKQKLADVFIVVLDSRAPISTYNIELDKIAPHKPRLFILSKIDYADPNKLNSLSEQIAGKDDLIIGVNLLKRKSRKKIIDTLGAIIENKKERNSRKGIVTTKLRVFVVGVPNSGKSTLINLLAQKKVVNVGDKPGVTRGQQWITVSNFQLLDTPGVLWPKFDDQLIPIKLAAIRSIRTEIFPDDQLAFSIYILISKYYPNKIRKLGLEPITENENNIDEQLNILGKSKNFIIKGNRVDMTKTYIWFISFSSKLVGVTYD